MKVSNYKYYFLITIYAVMVSSCGKNLEKDTIDENNLCIPNEDFCNVPIIDLERPDTLISFDETHPTGVAIHGSNIIIKTVQSDSCITVYDKQTLKPVWETGHYGQGPEDVIYPDFFASIWPEDSLFQMVDVSDKSHLFFDIENKRIKKEKLPKYVGFSSHINLLEDYVVAAVNTNEYMFYVYDKSKHHLTPVTSDVDCGNRIKSMDKDGMYIGYLLSCMIFANQKLNRIITPYYFFDEFSIYDFSGRLINKVCLSSKSYSEPSAVDKVIDDEGYVGYISGFAAEDACYMMRSSCSQRVNGNRQMQLVQTDWNGSPKNVYNLNCNILGNFFIDNNRHLYGIANPEDNDDDETYYLVRYDLNR